MYSIIGLYRFLAPVLALYFIKTPVGTAKFDENAASGLLKIILPRNSLLFFLLFLISL